MSTHTAPLTIVEFWQKDQHVPLSYLSWWTVGEVGDILAEGLLSAQRLGLLATPPAAVLEMVRRLEMALGPGGLIAADYRREALQAGVFVVDFISGRVTEPAESDRVPRTRTMTAFIRGTLL